MGNTLLSPLIPYGFHVEWKYSMDSTPFHVESIWNMFGLIMESTWNPCGIHMEWIYSIESMWNPHGIYFNP
ncbi:hypothetical protein BYT27DRAFT_7199564 [Phlegmacium glaucopus]|nr:hypothetical protein BYT27DRAFT_7199564 [Phlegmacium glaucopus]